MAASYGGDGDVRSLLVASLQTLERGLRQMVEKARKDFVTLTLDEFLSGNNYQSGVYSVYPVQLYVDCMVSVGVSSREELEQLWKEHYHHVDVQDSVEELLTAEEKYRSFIAEADEELQKCEDTIALASVTTVGFQLPRDLSLLEAVSGQSVSLESIWTKSRFTLFVLQRHFV